MSLVKKFQIEKLTVTLIIIFGIIMSFLVPTWQTPDEFTHIWMIGDSLRIRNFDKKIEESIALDRERVEFNYDEKIDINDQIASFTARPTYSREEMLPQGVSITLIKHFSATLGILLGILIGIPTYWVLQLGELFALLFYAIVCYYALKLMPIKKEVLAVVMLFPMALQQAASLNYDAVLIPLCFFFVAYIFHLRYSNDRVGIRQIIFALCLGGVITYIKFPYILFFILVFIIPLEKIEICFGNKILGGELLKKIRFPFLIIFGIVGFFVIYLMRHNKWIQIVYGFIIEWRRGLYLFLQTGKTWGEFLVISTVGNFGWLDTPMLLGAVISVIVFLITVSLIRNTDQKQYYLRKWDIFIIIVTIIAMIVFTTLSLVDHTIKVTLFGSEGSPNIYNIREAVYQIPYIGGLQGRYYLPFVCLFFLPYPRVIQVKKEIVNALFIVLEIILYIYVAWMLVNRYWIP